MFFLRKLKKIAFIRNLGFAQYLNKLYHRSPAYVNAEELFI